MPAMMLQARNSERSRVRVPVKQERFAPAKMSHTWTANFLRKAPASSRAVSLEFCRAVMSRDMLQVSHGSFKFSSLSSGVDHIIQHAHVAPGKQPRFSAG